jgi:hypothetical protein
MHCKGFYRAEIVNINLASNYSHSGSEKILAYPRKNSVFNKGCLYGFHMETGITESEQGYRDGYFWFFKMPMWNNVEFKKVGGK